jgi:hypothetical protein
VNFRIGQKVVCIKTPTHAYYKRTCPHRPVENGIYTVRGLIVVGGETGVYLEEVVNPTVFFLFEGRTEAAFHHGFFRPLIETKTDISVFKKMLTPNTREIENA